MPEQYDGYGSERARLVEQAQYLQEGIRTSEAYAETLRELLRLLAVAIGKLDRQIESSDLEDAALEHPDAH